MNIQSNVPVRHRRQTVFRVFERAWTTGVLLWVLAGPSAAAPAEPPAHPGPGYEYIHDVVPRVPWSIHVVKVDRSRADLQLDSALGGGTVQALNTVSGMIQALPSTLGKPIAAVNGDFFEIVPGFLEDPRGLQISRGELTSEPDRDYSCLWVDAGGDLHVTNVVSNFRVTWPDHRSMELGLNRPCGKDQVVLYTAALGATTRSNNGIELVLERNGNDPRLPLRVGQELKARVRERRAAGNTPLDPTVMVLSVGPGLTSVAGGTAPGTVLTLSTATTPSLTGARVGIGGGVTLLHEGKTGSWSAIQVRHPRTAVGWNATHIFLVVVDGRQRSSLGMTPPELANYMRKLGCTEALNLDGGGSVTMWLCGQIVNSPSGGAERAAANALVLVQRTPGKK